MLVEITEIRIADDTIDIIATDLDSIILADHLYDDINEKSVHFEFDRNARNGAHMKYLYKVCASQSRCKSARSMGEKLEKLAGAITTLSDSFVVKE